ncbi:hypothetical protein Cgig2_016544 [Carnegiea gigantea]|uniref:Uncharacterized protein n=1 Tax=Carnegiea gigantea TaxID=171969 RepID=A0A9Q1JIT8_9CARY|nr:hypothetical protein Cgig2_016544 [Carnegiea gigantea]
MNSARYLPTFNYVPTTGYEPSHRHTPVRSHHHGDEIRTDDPEAKNVTGPSERMPCIVVDRTWDDQQMPGSRSRSKPRSPEWRSQDCDTHPIVAWSGNTLATLPPEACTIRVKEHPKLKRLQPMTTTPKPHNVRKYCEFHEENGQNNTECRELRKAFHEQADKGQIWLPLRADTRRASLNPLISLNSEERNRFLQLNRGAALPYRRRYSMDKRARTLSHPTMTHYSKLTIGVLISCKETNGGPRVLPCQHPAARGTVGPARPRRAPTLGQKAVDLLPFPIKVLVIHMLALAEPD